jgi:HPt (histidine-containing phosphotransfer) domain-containing protein
MGDRQLADLALKAFLQDVPSQLNELQRRIEAADAPGTRMGAHALNGAASTVAAESLHRIALAIESAADAGRLDRCSELLPRAYEEIERFRNASQADMTLVGLEDTEQ